MNAIVTLPLVHAERAALVRRRRDSACAELWNALDAVKDPEIPVLSLYDLGVLRDIRRAADGVTVVLSPTYSGCPAMETMEADVRRQLLAAGVRQVVIERALSPPWTTDWMDARARLALKDYGIAPPDTVCCPQCGSHDASVVSDFGSTACKALYRCNACLEPFDHFKPL